jgi:catalase
VPGGADSVKALIQKGDAHVFIDEAYKHGKPIGAVGEGVELLTASEIGKLLKSISDSAAGAAPGAADTTNAGVQNLSEVGRMLLANDANASKLAAYGIIIGPNGDLQKVIKQFIAAVAHHRYWGRPRLEQVPA